MLTEMLIPTFTQMLRAQAGWLDKAAAQQRDAGEDPETLLRRRLAPDMFPLAAQIRFACFEAVQATYRLQGQALPQAVADLRREGWETVDRPGTLAEALARNAEALARLDSLLAGELDDGAAMMIELALPNGMIFDFTGVSYARDWALPQFYFHLDMAYAILRGQGIALGKADYVGHALAQMRPGTMPHA